MNEKWRFVSNLNAIDSGLNDAGIETFSGDSQKANIREVIQNSIDQISEEAKTNNRPVIVEFDNFTIKQNEFKGYDEFKLILKQCIDSSKDDQNVKRFFEQAVSLMENPINVLRISDYNTTGLVGAETGERGTPWHNLIKAQGSSNKNISSGGSFGIGKSAPFSCSNLRTVFYGSKVDDISSYIGVSRLISHFDGKEMTIGTGYYSNSDKLMAILDDFSLNGFERNSNGTDIYIMGYEDYDDIKKLIVETTLDNFFVSIHKGLLVVRYRDIEINSENLGQYIAALDDNTYAETKTYYNLLICNPSPDDEDIKVIDLLSDEYGKKFGIKDGEARLLLQRADNLNRRILMTRKPGMSLFKQASINASISFTGILLITGDTMNEIFKNMEMPAHDEWKPGRCKVNKEFYVSAYDELRAYLRNKVSECFGQTQKDTISAYRMEDFFSGVEMDEGKKKTSVLDGEVKITAKRSKTDSKLKGIVKGSKKEEYVEPPVPPVPKPEPPEPPVPPVPPEPPVPPKPKPEPKSRFKYVELKKRLINRSIKDGEYTLSFKVPKKKKRIKIEIFCIAEKGTYSMDMSNVAIRGIDNPTFSVNGNYVIINSVPSDSHIYIDFKIDFDHQCNLGVNYYED